MSAGRWLFTATPAAERAILPQPPHAGLPLCSWAGPLFPVRSGWAGSCCKASTRTSPSPPGTSSRSSGYISLPGAEPTQWERGVIKYNINYTIQEINEAQYKWSIWVDHFLCWWHSFAYKNITFQHHIWSFKPKWYNCIFFTWRYGPMRRFITTSGKLERCDCFRWLRTDRLTDRRTDIMPPAASAWRHKNTHMFDFRTHFFCNFWLFNMN